MKAKRFATAFPVDEVRRLRSFLAHRAAGDGWRVVIVDEANELNVNAANALLKSLEEPPARTVFLLVSSAPGSLVPTIRSRCRTLTLPPLDDRSAAAAATQALDAADSRRPPAARMGAAEHLAERQRRPPARVCSAQAASSCRAASTSSSPCCRRSTGRPCTPFPTSYNPSPRRPVSSCSSNCCSACACPADPRRRHGRGEPRKTRRWRGASSAIPGLPRLPPCGKE